APPPAASAARRQTLGGVLRLTAWCPDGCRVKAEAIDRATGRRLGMTSTRLGADERRRLRIRLLSRPRGKRIALRVTFSALGSATERRTLHVSLRR
nr:hypothetical protein [Actinomycetota bacterium]